MHLGLNVAHLFPHRIIVSVSVMGTKSSLDHKGHLSFNVDDAGGQTVLVVVNVLAFRGGALFTQDLVQPDDRQHTIVFKQTLQNGFLL